MTEWLGFMLLGFSPGLFWMWLIYQRDRYLPSPISLVVRTFIWGALAVIPIAAVEGVLSLDIDIDDGSASVNGLAYMAFIVAGGVEEVGKFLVVRTTLKRSPYLREPKDGMIFAAAAALGFASFENVGYIYSFGWEVILLRGPFSTVAHVVFAGIWGAALGMKGRRMKPEWIWYAVGAAALVHGAFDFFLFTDNAIWAFVLFIGGAIGFFMALRWAISSKGGSRQISRLQLSCAECGAPRSEHSRYCTNCGETLTGIAKGMPAACSVCGSMVRVGHHYCTGCGSRLVQA
jgi:RsiW-degrading membrane proteinase PrsW (M82 family)